VVSEIQPDVEQRLHYISGVSTHGCSQRLLQRIGGEVMLEPKREDLQKRPKFGEQASLHNITARDTRMCPYCAAVTPVCMVHSCWGSRNPIVIPLREGE